jgi:DNA-3-methyladenine glycosylase I
MQNRFLDIVEKHGSFQEYIDTFNPRSSPEALEALRVAIDEFKWVGPVNSRHYLSTIGMPMVKPDRVLCRVVYRLGFAPTPYYTDDATIEAVIKTAKLFADATDHSMHYVDLILVNFGRVSLGEEFEAAKSDRGICVLEAPQCNLCLAKDYCQYYKKGFTGGEVTVELLLEQAEKLTQEARAELIKLLQKLDE